MKWIQEIDKISAYKNGVNKELEFTTRNSEKINFNVSKDNI